MKVQVIGKKKTEFTDDKTGELKQYARIYYTFSAPDNTTVNTFDGVCCSDKAIAYKMYDSIDIGDRLILDFDEKGRVIDLDIIE